MRHLIFSRELPPASYAPGGIGTYVANIARLMAEAGETVHVIGERWPGAPREREEQCDGRLVIHRVALDVAAPGAADGAQRSEELRLLGATPFPAQRFAWRAALLAESLVQREGIDVIEGQDWEAPLYYFLGRRALGVGPERHPPCIVHLHTPTEFIFGLNGWTPNRPEQLATIRMEEYCIGAADALVCPSQYLARQIVARYAVPDEIAVIPYPLGDIPSVERDEAVWRDGPFVYVGRLEPRKGLIEFVDAAVDVARTNGTVSFDFVGEDGWYCGRLSVRQYMEGRIQRALRERFRFHGVQPRSRIPEILGRSRALVIPSRGENFPNACIEAMCSGLPVISSPNGGMVEMLDDGVTGWIAPSQSAQGLAQSLRRALATPAAKYAAMGRAAALAIRERCNNDTIVRQQLALRTTVAERGAARSLGTTTYGVPVPAFTPVTSALELSVRDILRLPMRDKASLAIGALHHPKRALAWLRSVLTRP